VAGRPTPASYGQQCWLTVWMGTAGNLVFRLYLWDRPFDSLLLVHDGHRFGCWVLTHPCRAGRMMRLRRKAIVFLKKTASYAVSAPVLLQGTPLGCRCAIGNALKNYPCTNPDDVPPGLTACATGAGCSSRAWKRRCASSTRCPSSYSCASKARCKAHQPHDVSLASLGQMSNRMREWIAPRDVRRLR
jgi:hypothetical protein